MSELELNWKNLKDIKGEDSILQAVFAAEEEANSSYDNGNMDKFRAEIDALKGKGLGEAIVTALEKRYQAIENRRKRLASDALGEFIRHERDAQGMTLAQLAEKTGVSPSYINRIEKGERRAPSISIIERLAEALDAPISAFLSASNQLREESPKVVPLAQLLFGNEVSLRKDGLAIKGKKKSALIDVIEFIGAANWGKEKHKELAELLELLDNFYDEN